MSVIAFKVDEKYIQVAADSRVVAGSVIISENENKIYQISDSLIIGATGFQDIKQIYLRFVLENQANFTDLTTVTECLSLFKKFKEFIKEVADYTTEMLRDCAFLVVNKQFHGIVYFDDNVCPYIHGELPDNKTYVMGNPVDYVTALLDYGLSPKEAIQFAARKYISINDNVKVLEIKYND